MSDPIGGWHFRRRDILKFVGLTPAVIAGGALIDVPRATANIAGKSVFLDAGHSGVFDSSLNRPVPNGRNGEKPCNTSGTATNDGYPEHAFTFAVVQLVAGALQQAGVQVQQSRYDDGSVGPCIDERAAVANAMRPDAIVSIHADGGPPNGRGFHVNYSSPPINEVQTGPAIRLANTMRDALAAAGLQPANYIGSNGLYGRADLAGLNLAQFPAVLVELGNMRNAEDAAQIASPEGRARYADAVVAGITNFLSQ
ncbi:N-acetylmuramoyl-L-alanine amidase [Mycobacterium intermedium]|uniref:N-acetylmuramoyl-L-alanine amidase n=1 Tax=Mycobacterium intermedium TaxID=28445 RepID=A0A1E3SAK9_MYCIE|nr:Rv3717 family N-acetylmuramoyl-L-alanine amidase [Mycobacterium intermedium]MCV6967724.1 Rv3717 family N-acetylmuramoyl-L-alanine amidase [Mycobacterium intermedium]ODQ99114.1 N-acetylmuramoyl-L-alanine amidase [Mycobacterium intermedium]OPE46159.1 N-acetylmuramoyl-L-alanine amidase [Mycobacterium intermedium]ORB05527.1 N-acetylmuramoyl-L-alanine amidase [Mycobacterium intermedium]